MERAACRDRRRRLNTMPLNALPRLPRSSERAVQHTIDTYRPSRATASTRCPGQCNARSRRAEQHAAETGEPHDVSARAGEPVWCRPCTAAVLSALRDMPELAVRLQLEVENGTTAPGEHVSGSRERPLHQRQVPARLIEEIGHTLTAWEDDVRDHHTLSARRRELATGPAITAATKFLHAHFDWVMQTHDPAATEAFGSELLSLYRRTQRVTKTDEPRPVMCAGVPCPRCDMMTLERELHSDGSETGYIHCRYCPSLLNQVEYERWTKLVAEPHRKRAAA